jgi:glycosyltransferase involved in cell wall biosynthesis
MPGGGGMTPIHRDPGSPFLYTTSARPGTRARTLLVTSAFPPCAEVGAARWEGFAPHLVDAGWGIDVITEDPTTLPIVDWQRLEALPADVRAIGIPRPLPAWVRTVAALKRRARGIRGETAGPPAPVATAVNASGLLREDATSTGDDLRLRLLAEGEIQQAERWARRVEQAGRRLVSGAHRVVVSSGPLNIAYVAAARIARASGLPHVMDMRDPWTTALVPNPPLTRMQQRDGERDEAATIAGAARIITNTAASAARLVDRFPMVADRVVTIPNGVDLTPIPARDAPPVDRFIIAHCGTLYLDRDPRTLMRAIARLVREEGIAPDALRLVFMGVPTLIEGESIVHWGEAAGIGPYVEERPLGTREEARALLLQSAVAVAFQGRSVIQIPAKVFEYAAFPLWLLALVGEESATAELLRGSTAIVLGMHEEERIHAALLRAWRTFRATGRPDPVAMDGRFSRKHQSQRLLDVLEQVGSHARTRRR